MPICTSLPYFCCACDQQRALGGVMAAGLFDVDVLARLQAEDGHGRMPVVGRGDGDGVDVLASRTLRKSFSVVGRVAQLALRLAAANLARMLLSTSQT